MKERFEGEDGKRRLISALEPQKICAGDSSAATALAEAVTLLELEAGKVLIHEGNPDNDTYFILSGTFSILVKGTQVATRSVNDHVGEMSAIDPSLPRSATVIADNLSVVAQIPESELAKIANAHPQMWRNLAKELAKRLNQRNSLIRPPNDQARVFIISSKEALNIAHEIQSILIHDFLVTVWTDGIFFASSYAIEALEKTVDESDFAIAIVQPDDQAHIRDKDYNIARDNVIFELGLFMGRLGRERAILFQPEGQELRLPSDLHGLTAVSYQIGQGRELTSRLAPACHEVRKVVAEHGTRK